MPHIKEVICTKGNAIAALVVLSLLLSSTLLVTPVSAKTTIGIQPPQKLTDQQFFTLLIQQMWQRLQKGDVTGATVLLATKLGSFAASKL